jgi:ankyrin repeat protein
LSANTYTYFPPPYSIVQFGVVLTALATYNWWRPERPLHEAAKVGDLEAVRNAVKRKDVNIRSIKGEIALHYACRFASGEMVSFLVQNGAEINAANIGSESPLHWAVASATLGNVEILVLNGANCNSKDDLGQTPIYWAVSRNLLDIALLLANHGSDIETRNNEGKTLIEVANENQYEEMADLLRRLSSQE